MTSPSVLFVRGCARSGTTLLADILNEHPQIGILVEQPLGDVAHRLLDLFWFEEHVRGQREAIATGMQASKAPGGDHFAPLENLDRMHYPRRYPTRARLAQILTGVVAASLEKPDLAVIGSKTPGHWNAAELEIVQRSFDRVRYVFVVRNPFDTLNSIVNRRNAARAGRDLWPDKPIDEAIGRYQEGIALLLSCRAAYPDETFVVGYEDLVNDPQRTLAQLGTFLEVDLDDRSSLIQPSKPSKNVLTADEEAGVRQAFGSALATWDRKQLTGPAARLGDRLDDCVRVVTLGQPYRCDAPVGDRGLLGSGWSGAEPRGIWSDAEVADLSFAVPRDDRYDLVFEIGAYVPSRREPLTVEMTLADRTYEWSLRNGRNRRLHCRGVQLAAGRAHRLCFRLGPLRSPHERGRGSERRRLGICLRRLTVRRS